MSLSLEDLMEVEISTSGSLTGSTRRLSPSTITTITREEVRRTAARSINELLDILVPNLQVIRQNEHQITKLGLRGIVYTRDDKYLLLVNGRTMNEHTNFGVTSERDLPMLSDIHHIDVVRGPGSAMYGPGAIAMVINIVTDNALTFEGTEVTSRLGAIEEFYTAEVKHGKKFSEDSGIFLYAGASKYVGADVKNSPLEVGQRNVTWNGRTYHAGDHITDGVWGNNQTLNDWLKWKLHGQYTNGGLDIWGRYTRGSDRFDGNDTGPHGDAYQQWTAYTSYTHDLSETFSMKYILSYDRIYVNNPNETDNKRKRFREDEYYGRIQANWKPRDNHSLVFGYEHSHEEYGLDGYESSEALLYTMGGEMPRWGTDMASWFGEYQWNISEQWTTFVGGRADRHRFTDIMWSPRAALIYTPTEKDTFKLMATRSVRMNNANEMKRQYDNDNTPEESETEQLDALELRYERQHTDALWFGGSTFVHCHDMIGYANGGNRPTGFQKSWGFELEGRYQTEKVRIDVSHGFTKLRYIDLAPGVTSIEGSAAPMGFGNDLGAWSNHITKIRARYALTNEISLDGSLRWYWGFPGAMDMAKYHNQYTPGYDDPYEDSIFLNLGIEYRPIDSLTFRVDGYNMLGCFDSDLNKRINWNGPSLLRSEAPGIGVTMSYRF